jgi:hypothetical protein
MRVSYFFFLVYCMVSSLRADFFHSRRVILSCLSRAYHFDLLQVSELFVHLGIIDDQPFSQTAHRQVQAAEVLADMRQNRFLLKIGHKA